MYLLYFSEDLSENEQNQVRLQLQFLFQNFFQFQYRKLKNNGINSVLDSLVKLENFQIIKFMQMFKSYLIKLEN